MEKHTEILQPTDLNILRCASALKAGGLVAFPTETVYALGAVATNEAAIKKLFAVKNRPLDRALIVGVAKKSQIGSVVKCITPAAQRLIDKFMPGALTLVMEKSECIPDIVTAGSSSVAVRIPDNDIARKLIELAKAPVVVPSANTSDKPSTTLAEHVLCDLDGMIDYIIDGGQSEIGIESTIVDVRCSPPVILRVGGVTVESIEREIGPVLMRREEVKQSAYTPNAEVLFSAFYDGMTDNIAARYDDLASKGVKTVILCLDSTRGVYGDRNVISLGADYTAYAHNLFAALRRADGENYEAIIAEGVDPNGIGSSLIARLIKLSGGSII